MHDVILDKLAEIEREDQVQILYACESGSRAWGFPSADSDYDVRFIYVRPQDWYLSIDIERKRDVIERPINDLLDVSGWDLRKALQLFYKSNPPLLEWLGSPIIYSEPSPLAEQLRELAKTYYNPLACSYHYLHMAQGNYRSYLKGDTIRVKKYFYVLRPILAINWLEQDRGVPPTDFNILVRELLPENQLRNDIEELIRLKRTGSELDSGTQIASISSYLDAEILRLEGKDFQASVKKLPVAALNAIFRETILQA